jgi:hypothetical protein
MTTIYVFRYKVYSPEHGTHLETDFPVYATLEKIDALKAEPVISSRLEIDETQLNDDGRYQP